VTLFYDHPGENNLRTQAAPGYKGERNSLPGPIGQYWQSCHRKNQANQQSGRKATLAEIQQVAELQLMI
jgi:hypothetical protein